MSESPSSSVPNGRLYAVVGTHPSVTLGSKKSLARPAMGPIPRPGSALAAHIVDVEVDPETGKVQSHCMAHRWHASRVSGTVSGCPLIKLALRGMA